MSVLFALLALLHSEGALSVGGVVVRLVFAARHDQSHMAYSPQYTPEYTGGLGRSAQTRPHSGGALLLGSSAFLPRIRVWVGRPKPILAGGSNQHLAKPGFSTWFGSVGPNSSSQWGCNDHGAQPSFPAYEFGSVGPNPSSLCVQPSSS